MNWLVNLLTEPVVAAIGWTLLHSLWQGGLIAALLGCGLTLSRRASAAFRYALAYSGLLLMVGVSAATFSIELKHAHPGNPVSAQHEAARPLPQPKIQQASERGLAEEPRNGSRLTLLAPLPPGSTSFMGISASSAAWLGDGIQSMLPWLVFAWMAGVSILSLRLAGGWLRLLQLRASIKPAPSRSRRLIEEIARRLDVRRRVELLESAAVRVPSTAGWLKPIVLFPASALAGLSPAQLEAVLAHELAHIRRHDYLANLLQSVLESLFFFHPAAWWISARIRAERENCCDDLAVQACGDALGYAGALARLESLRAAQPALGAGGSCLVDRVRRLVSQPAPVSASRSTAAAAAAILLSVATALAAGGALRGTTPIPSLEPSAGGDWTSALPNGDSQLLIRPWSERDWVWDGWSAESSVDPREDFAVWRRGKDPSEDVSLFVGRHRNGGRRISYEIKGLIRADAAQLTLWLGPGSSLAVEEKQGQASRRYSLHRAARSDMSLAVYESPKSEQLGPKQEWIAGVVNDLARLLSGGVSQGSAVAQAQDPAGSGRGIGSGAVSVGRPMGVASGVASASESMGTASGAGPAGEPRGVASGAAWVGESAGAASGAAIAGRSEGLPAADVRGAAKGHGVGASASPAGEAGAASGSSGSPAPSAARTPSAGAQEAAVSAGQPPLSEPSPASPETDKPKPTEPPADADLASVEAPPQAALAPLGSQGSFRPVFEYEIRPLPQRRSSLEILPWEEWDHLKRVSGRFIMIRNDTFYSRWEDGGSRMSVQSQGEVDFADDDRSISRLSSGGYFMVEEIRGGAMRRYELRQESSGLVARIYQNSRASSLGEPTAWLEEALLETLRFTGISAELRAQRILEDEGAGALLAEVERLTSNSARRRYLRAALESGKLEVGHTIRAVELVARIVSSNSDKSRLVGIAAESFKDNSELTAALIEAAATISSNSNRRRSLIPVMDRNSINDPRLAARLLDAIRTMSSNSAKTTTLVLAASKLRLAGDSERAYFKVIDSISSSSNRTRALLDLLQRQDREEGARRAESIFRSSSGISSGSNRASVLVKAVERGLVSDRSHKAFFESVGGISSSSEKARVLSQLGRQAEVGEGVLRALLRSARSISSGSALSRLLIEFASQHSLEGELGEEFFRTLDSISNASLRENVLSAVNARSGLSSSLRRSVYQAAGRIGNNHHKARALIGTLKTPQALADAGELEAFLVAARSISSDSQKGKVLAAALRTADLTPKSADGLLRVARGIDNDSELGRFLAAFSQRFQLRGELADRFFSAADALGSAHRSKDLMSMVIRTSDLDQDGRLRFLKSVRRINSDSAKTSLLIESADLFRDPPELRQAYQEVADGIRSSHKHRQAMSALRHPRNPQR